MNLRQKKYRTLVNAFLTCNSFDMMAEFLRDICTAKELESMAERLQVAQLVEQGIPYRTIAQQTGASTATITRVAHWMKHGMGGYARVLEKI